MLLCVGLDAKAGLPGVLILGLGLDSREAAAACNNDGGQVCSHDFRCVCVGVPEGDGVWR